MKRLIFCLSVAGMLGLSACATSPQAAQSSATPSAAASAASRDDKPSERYCLRSTGSRIVVRDNATGEAPDFEKRCLALGGRAYNREDLERTGETNIADALRKLDPAIR